MISQEFLHCNSNKCTSATLCLPNFDEWAEESWNPIKRWFKLVVCICYLPKRNYNEVECCQSKWFRDQFHSTFPFLLQEEEKIVSPTQLQLKWHMHAARKNHWIALSFLTQWAYVVCDLVLIIANIWLKLLISILIDFKFES